MAVAYGKNITTIIDGLYITNIEVTSRCDRIVPSIFGSGESTFLNVEAQTEIEIRGIIHNPEILKLFYGLSGNPLTVIKAVEEEYFCIYCNSINPLTNRFCSQCGASRGFLIGHNTS